MVFSCTRCSRLTTFLLETKEHHPDYFCQPVPPFGDDNAQLLIVGLAPGMHGANRTGRPFTGDYAGILLYQTLHDFKFCNHSESINTKDGLLLQNVKITNAVKCLPPQNKPLPTEIKECNSYLAHEILDSHSLKVILALGKIAHDAVLTVFNEKKSVYPFKHGSVYQLKEKFTLISSYHCSRYNTQTNRLTKDMFYSIFKEINLLLDRHHEYK
ncbi:uracil-DNA glycosylase [Ferrovum sp. PN-J185]|uniref:uracil-DNA glycosylase n=1 Tax=Ferrovum sp. PN-J185 TaxID=1356306 RepID=UPI001E43874E|nr:uracil-DNA glycosylase [Ferrovum sp. PN-J185]MCC6069311.1 uracil-DNA glycosylase [Ferrovum sp. PN-J185]